MRQFLIVFITPFILLSCNSARNKKVGPPTGPVTETGSKIDPVESSDGSEWHRVTAEEILNTSRYTYIRVLEAEKKYWIAVLRQNVTPGEEYLYSNALFKKNFVSSELDRTFDTLFLVPDIRKISEISDQPVAGHMPEDPNPDVEKTVPNPLMGEMELSQLIADPEKYAGKIVKVTGRCIKVNPNILNRNWIHIQEGEDTGQELTVTTKDNVKLGETVSVEGIINLDRDFGAGYRYDVIMENARVIRQ